jgi:hypothetical protein
MINLDNMPEGATHYASDVAFYRLHGERPLTWMSGIGEWFDSVFVTTEEAVAAWGDNLKEIPMKKEESDLDWLVRETNGVWPDGDKGIARLGDMKVSTPHPELVYFCPRWYTKDEYLCRKAELQNKPSWSSAEADAEWMAQRPDGKWGFFSVKPSTDNRGWTHEGGYAWMSGNCGEVLGNWCDTLERRPAESVAATQPHGDGDDWFGRGDLPPVGVWCEAFCDGAGPEKCKIIAYHKQQIAVQWTQFNNGCLDIVDMPGWKFRPIQTERQRTIADMVDIMIGTPVNDKLTATERLTAVASAIYDKFISKQGGAA